MDGLVVIPLLLLLGAVIIILMQRYWIRDLTRELATTAADKRRYKSQAARKTMLEQQPPPAASVSIKEFQEVIIGRDASHGSGYSTPPPGPGLNLVGGHEESRNEYPQELPHMLSALDLPTINSQAVNP